MSSIDCKTDRAIGTNIGKIETVIKKISVNFLLLLFMLGACVPDANLESAAINTPTIKAENDIADESTINDEESAGSSLPETIPAEIGLNFWHPWSGELANLVDELTAEYNAENEWGITVNTTFHADNRLLIQDFLDASEGNSIPNIIAAPSYFLQLLSDINPAPVPLDDFINSPGWGFIDFNMDETLSLFWEVDTDELGRIGVPAYRTAHIVFINKSWAAELGFGEENDDLSFITELICAASRSYLVDDEPENDGLGGLAYSYDPFAIYSWLRVFAGGIPGDKSQPTSFLLDENNDALGYLHDQFFDDCAWIGRQPLPHQYFSKRQAIAYSGKLEDIFIQEQVNNINGVEDEWTVLPYPSLDDGKPILLVEGHSYAILGDDEETNLAAWDFIRWMLQKDNQVRIIEATGSLPLIVPVIQELDEFAQSHPAWHNTIQLLPFGEHAAISPNWMVAQDILSDLSRRLIQFTTSKDDIEFLLDNADQHLKEQSGK